MAVGRWDGNTLTVAPPRWGVQPVADNSELVSGVAYSGLQLPRYMFIEEVLTEFTQINFGYCD